MESEDRFELVRTHEYTTVQKRNTAASTVCVSKPGAND